jgi:hypothetical protein
MTPEQRRALMSRVLDDHPGLAALIPRTAHVPLVPQPVPERLPPDV